MLQRPPSTHTPMEQSVPSIGRHHVGSVVGADVSPTRSTTAALRSSFCASLSDTRFRLGILLPSLQRNPNYLVPAISKSVSLCSVHGVCVLEGDGATDTHDGVVGWCCENKIDNDPQIFTGATSFLDMIRSPQLDGIYMAGLIKNRASLVRQALQGGKHVLVDDPISTNIREFIDLLQTASSCGKHLQHTTLFLHQFAVRELLDVILESKFGDICDIHVSFKMNPNDPKYESVVTPSIDDGGDHQRKGCIGSLGRYCLVFGLLIQCLAKHNPTSVRVTHLDKDQEGIPTGVVAQVSFDNGGTLTLDCGYMSSNNSRQMIEVESETHKASLSDFVFSSHTRACYQMYEKRQQLSGKQEVVGGAAVDVGGGPFQEVMLWRQFAELSMATTPGRQTPRSASILFYVSLQSQNVINAMMQSIEGSGEEVQVDQLSMKFPDLS